MRRVGRYQCHGYGCRKHIEKDIFYMNGFYWYYHADRPVRVTPDEFKYDWYEICQDNEKEQIEMFEK